VVIGLESHSTVMVAQEHARISSRTILLITKLHFGALRVWQSTKLKVAVANM
jgi:hypothetical protein